MKYKKAIAIYSIIVGIAMIAIWVIQLLTGQATELETTPIRIALAIAADWVTAIALIASGIGLTLNRQWAFKLYLFSLGMLAYSVIVSSGYFGQLGNTVFVVLFAVLFVLIAIFVMANLFSRESGKTG